MTNIKFVGNLNYEFAKPEDHPSLNPTPLCLDTAGKKSCLVQGILDQKQDSG